MKRINRKKRYLVAVCVLFLLATGLARAEDVGAEVERIYGVVGRDTAERRGMNDELDRVVQKMSGAVGFKPKSVTLLGGKDPRRDKEINAFALPDGRIFVLAGLMVASQTTSNPEASVAFVLGHEMTHVTHHHGRSQLKQNLLSSIGIAVLARAMGASPLTAARTSDIGSGLIMGHFSRKDEYEADEGGIGGMAKAGYPVDSAAEMMQVLLDTYGDDKSAMAAWFGSHPITQNRVLRLKDMAADLKAGRTPTEPKEEESKGEDRAMEDQKKK